MKYLRTYLAICSIGLWGAGGIVNSAVGDTTTDTVIAGSEEPRLATEEDVIASLTPYANGISEYQLIPKGTVINSDNVDQYLPYMDEALADIISAGFYEIKVGETSSFRPHEKYIAATLAHLNKARLGDEQGILEGYVAGRPFPQEPQLNDPRAGERLAWNFRYAYGGDGSVLPVFLWKYKDMRREKLERTLEMESARLNFKHRLSEKTGPDLPRNPSQIYTALYLNVKAPQDIRNTQLLVHRLEDDRERDRTWMYMSTQRRVRRLGSGQTTDAFLGSDIMIEDFLGYNGRIMDMKWTYKGTVNTLLAYFNHDEMPLVQEKRHSDGFKYVGFTGKGKCFPDVTWQLRKAYVLEAEPLNKSHPLSKRVFYVDVQTHTMSLVKMYDRGGKLWKLGMAGFSHPDHHLPVNKGTGINIIDGASMIDIQNQHCTTLHFKSEYDPDVSPNKFSVQYMRTQSR
ncbi:MAG: outer membrane lipoprotein-sorting protein [Kordiimonas sp.]|nr:outer membrane lipoprotein-sorting protein [Kordiimonas sp.]